MFQHDNTVMALLHALSASNHLQPPYAATVLIELYAVTNASSNDVEHVVKVWYKNETDAEPYLLPMKGVPIVCNCVVFHSA